MPLTESFFGILAMEDFSREMSSCDDSEDPTEPEEWAGLVTVDSDLSEILEVIVVVSDQRQSRCLNGSYFNVKFMFEGW